MQQYHSFDEVQLKDAFVTIGTYDGVHRGHQAILKPLAEAAHAAGCPAVVVTFSPHPVAVLRGTTERICLTTPEERAEQIGALGIDVVITLKFDKALAALTAEEFMRLASKALGLRELWEGPDFALGRNRQGDIPRLQAIGAELGYTVRVTDEVKVDGERISSSLIRELVRQGQVTEAAKLLGRPYAMSGPVIHGDGRGRQLGFPTANVGYPNSKIVPAYGVYATWTWISGEDSARRIPSVSSIGERPTFDPPGSPARLEAYLIDFSEDIYGQEARVEFLEFLRPELRFDSAQALIDQMVEDTIHAREALEHAA